MMTPRQLIIRYLKSIPDRLQKRKMVLRVPLLYLLFAALWIILSDTLVEGLFPDRQAAALAQTYKGWFFVLVTAILLAVALRKELILHDHDQQRIGLIQTALNETSIRFRMLFESSPVGIAVSNGSTITYCNPEFAIMFGFPSVKELEGCLLIDRIAGVSRDDFSMSISFATKDLLNSVQFEAQGLKKDGSEISLVIQAGKIYAGAQRDLVSFFIDSTRQKNTEKDLLHQIEKLNALRKIDSAINFSMELKPVLVTILEQVTNQLKVDAACIYLLRNDCRHLEFSVSLGFRTDEFHRSRIPIGEDPAGEAVLSRKTIAIPDLNASQPFSNQKGIIAEGFRSAYVIPLLAKGKVKGVLEVFHRSVLNPESVWLDFLDTLVGQTAIAIDNAFAYEDLHHSNMEIIRAYEETIEGWSNALDMRDHETEGHTKRVTTLTLNMVDAMDLGSPDMIHIQRGALLHDIGKMGIPDSILLKPGPLTPQEREIMNRHPVYARELLSPIAYLRPAMEIPFCHHEKWDGTGYPRGLRGEEIPLEARIFSVVDVYDALRSDRPYRKAWTDEDTLHYLLERSGKDFDPQVVGLFMHLMKRHRDTFLKDSSLIPQ
jgi:PAS domain S-box-containing protein